MNTLMTVWLLTGQPIQLYTSERMCSFAMEAIASKGAVVVTMSDGEVVRAVAVSCTCPVDEGEPL